jgi:thiosulfate/3-mercaptopyruvate sulfurtransferase
MGFKRTALHTTPLLLVLVLLLLAGCRNNEEATGDTAETATADTTATPPPMSEFANPGLLVSTDWLEGHLEDEAIRIVDARSEDDHAEGHVPGAVHIAPSDTFDPAPEPGSVVGPPEQIAQLFGNQGIDEYAHVIVYDGGRATGATRLFWTLEYYGHPNVSVLNGGITKWKAEGRALSTDVPEVSPATFTVRARPDVLATKGSILEELEGEDEDGSAMILDARSDAEFTGERVLAERGGHIPGAVNLEWTNNFTESEAPVFKSALELARMYEEAGVTKDKRVHAY